MDPVRGGRKGRGGRQNSGRGGGHGRGSLPLTSFPPELVVPLRFDCLEYIGSPNRRVPRRRRSGYPVDSRPEIPAVLEALVPQSVAHVLSSIFEPVVLESVAEASTSNAPHAVSENLPEIEISSLRSRPDEYVVGLASPFAKSETDKPVLKKKKVTRKTKKREVSGKHQSPLTEKSDSIYRSFSATSLKMYEKLSKSTYQRQWPGLHAKMTLLPKVVRWKAKRLFYLKWLLMELLLNLFKRAKTIVPEMVESEVLKRAKTIVPEMVESEVREDVETIVSEMVEANVTKEVESIVSDMVEASAPEMMRPDVPEIGKDIVLDVPKDVDDGVPEVQDCSPIEDDDDCSPVVLVDPFVPNDPVDAEDVSDVLVDVPSPRKSKEKKKNIIQKKKKNTTPTPPENYSLDEMIIIDDVDNASTFGTSELRKKNTNDTLPKNKGKGKQTANGSNASLDVQIKEKPKMKKNIESSSMTFTDMKVSFPQEITRGAVTLMKDVVLEESAVERILETPFGHFLNVQPMVVNNFQLDDLCGKFLSKYTFELKKKEVRMTIEDVGKILSIPYRGTPIDLVRANNDTDLWRKFFDKGRKSRGRRATAISCKDVIMALQTQSKIPCASEEDVDDLCRLWLVLLFSTFNLPSSKMGLNGRVLSYIDNLKVLHLINWAECVRYLIFLNMRDCKRAVLKREDDKIISKPYLFGYILIWLWEHAVLWVKPNPKAVHVYEKWQGVQEHRRQTISSLKSRLVSDLPSSYELQCPPEEDDSDEEGPAEEEGSGSDMEEERKDSDSQVQSRYRVDFIPYVRVVKPEKTLDRWSGLSGLTGFRSPPVNPRIRN
ncbi:hypothetical protein ZOSMA_374G00180 [Zostera marina]|uniref:Aminotransferase-like plant mobile domain-containing protein n=1 Tax=Zostera marina TaxID=29655 RepID=A0A0K9P7X2_ZOSMR|nr:hypothetical protein ZOSMA_374G00180 [Zostera marina]